MANWNFAKTANRQVLGSMNDFANSLTFHVGSGETIQKLQKRLGRLL
jgi:hypothetical protein